AQPARGRGRAAHRHRPQADRHAGVGPIPARQQQRGASLHRRGEATHRALDRGRAMTSPAPGDFYDALETRDPAQREAALMTGLPDQVAAAQRTAGLARRLADIDAGTITSREALSRLPVLRKQELLADQQAAREAGGDPMGGFSAIGWQGLTVSRGARRV